MKKLKTIAYELIDLKVELLNERYSIIVKRALEGTVDQMLKSGFIDLNTQLYLKDNNFSLEEFTEYIHNNESFKKSLEELSIEYEKLVEELNESTLIRDDLNKDISFKYDIMNEKILLCKVFRLEDDFLKSYFYLKDDKDSLYLEKLKKKKGFVEKFAILRLPRIFSNFIETCDVSSSFSIEKSYPYYDSNKNSYSIDLIFFVNTSEFEKVENRDIVLNDISLVVNNANRYFNERMSI